MKFGSWTYDGLRLNMTKYGSNVDLSNYMAHPEWELLKATAKRNVVYYPCCAEPYIDITYDLTLKYKHDAQSNEI